MIITDTSSNEKQDLLAEITINCLIVGQHNLVDIRIKVNKLALQVI